MTTTGAVDGVWLIRGTRTLRALHALLALAALVGVGIELATASTGGPGMADSRAERLVRLFSFFTIQSNLVVALAGILIAVAPLRVGRVRAVIHLDALLCITVTGIVYHTLLAGDSGALTPSGWLANFLLHTVTPVGAWLVWLAVGPRPRFSGATVLWAVAYPLAWIAYTFVRGGITGWYPYPFLDAGEIGLGAATRNTALVAVGFLLLAALVRLLERVLPAAPRAVPETPCAGDARAAPDRHPARPRRGRARPAFRAHRGRGRLAAHGRRAPRRDRFAARHAPPPAPSAPCRDRPRLPRRVGRERGSRGGRPAPVLRGQQRDDRLPRVPQRRTRRVRGRPAAGQGRDAARAPR
jgi:hypothetical protein